MNQADKAVSAVPQGIEVIRNPGEVCIVRPWINLATFALTPLGIMVAGISLVLFRITHRAHAGHTVHYLPLFVGLAALAYLYVLATRYLNKTTLHISSSTILVEHGPLPWRSDVEIDASAVHHLYLNAVQVRYRGATAHFHHVWAKLKDGSQCLLIEGEMSENQAAFLKYQIEDVLGLSHQTSFPAPPTHPHEQAA